MRNCNKILLVVGLLQFGVELAMQSGTADGDDLP